ncbi:PDZ/DHR/GLGF domain-containing protein [Stenotrophomonas maltophilia]|nr:PDZ/DHR/GLGF domain-containing protein [Stenotrophomonas maltophilia]
MCELPRTALQCAMLIMLVPFAAGAAVTEVPFELGKDHRIYVEGTINGSRPLRFLVDTGASAMAVARHIQQDAKLVIDDQSENTGSDGVTLLDYSTHNAVQIGGVQRPMGAVVIDYTGRPFDAVLGWTFFQGKVLEIDYDRSLLRVHDDVPDLAGYVRANVRWIDNIPAIQVTLGNGSSTFAPWLTLDTGSNGNIDLSYAFGSAHRLHEAFPERLGTSQFSGSSGRKIRAVDVRVPVASISTLQLKGPKASITVDDDGSTDDGTLGSEVLQQFNILLDARSGSIYLRPNRRFVATPAG